MMILGWMIFNPCLSKTKEEEDGKKEEMIEEDGKKEKVVEAVEEGTAKTTLTQRENSFPKNWLILKR